MLQNIINHYIPKIIGAKIKNIYEVRGNLSQTLLKKLSEKISDSFFLWVINDKWRMKSAGKRLNILRCKFYPTKNRQRRWLLPPPRAETLPCGALVCATAHAPHCNISATLRVLGGEQKISSGTGKPRERIARSNGCSGTCRNCPNRSRGSTRRPYRPSRANSTRSGRRSHRGRDH